MKFTTALILILVANMGLANATPMDDEYSSSDSSVEESNEPSDEEFTEEILEMKERNGSREAVSDNSRINWAPSQSAGKIVIKVHKISATNPKEYLEVF